MSFNNQQSFIRNDRFGNPYQLKTLVQAVNKKSGELLDGCYKGYVELGGKLYKIEVSPRQKEMSAKYEGKDGLWCKVTAVKKQSRATSM